MNRKALLVLGTLAAIVSAGVLVVLYLIPEPDSPTVPVLAGTVAPVPEPPADAPEYGAWATGPINEGCATDGLVVEVGDYPGAIDNAAPGSTMLIRGGEYSGGFSIPAGRANQPTVVKPYNCEAVTVVGNVDVDSWTIIAGLTLTSEGENWTMNVKSAVSTPMTNVVIRNNVIRGGEVEAIRVAQNVRDIDITGNDLDGGLKRHVLKVHWEESEWRPANIRIVNNVFHKDVTGSGTDLIQLEGHQTVLIEHNTFHKGADENGVDVKSAGSGGGVTIRGNYFDGATIKQGCLLVQGNEGNNVVAGNYFDNGCKVALGAHLSASWWRFEDNVIDDGGTLQLRRSFGAEVIGNTMIGGQLKLGVTASDDWPRDAVIVGNTFNGVQLSDRVTSNGGGYTCHSNELNDVTGDLEACAEVGSS